LPVVDTAEFGCGSGHSEATTFGPKRISRQTCREAGQCPLAERLYELGAFAQPDIDRWLEILHANKHAAMQQVGAPSIKPLAPAMARRTRQ
jgi:hypothetical protein